MNRDEMERAIQAMQAVPSTSTGLSPRGTSVTGSATSTGWSGTSTEQRLPGLNPSPARTPRSSFSDCAIDIHTKKDTKIDGFMQKIKVLLRDYRGFDNNGGESIEENNGCDKEKRKYVLEKQSFPRLKKVLNIVFVSTGIVLFLGVVTVIFITFFTQASKNAEEKNEYPTSSSRHPPVPEVKKNSIPKGNITQIGNDCEVNGDFLICPPTIKNKKQNSTLSRDKNEGPTSSNSPSEDRLIHRRHIKITDMLHFRRRQEETTG